MSTSKKKFWFVIISILIALVLVELGVRLVFALQGHGPLDSRMRELYARQALNAYKGQDWVKEYYLTDLRNLRLGIDPLVGWRPKEYHGKYLNIDVDGLRKTWNPSTSIDVAQDKSLGAGPSAGAKKVFMFGGSTMWGAGGRDDYTIPSIVSKVLNSEGSEVGSKKSRDYVVTNYGQSGYVLVQEIAKLTYLLEKGERPDYVVFYDGANDVSYAYESGVAGVDGDARLIGEQLTERLDSGFYDQFKKGTRDFLKSNCAMCNAAFDLMKKFSPDFANTNVVVGQNFDEEKIAAFAKEIASEYKNNRLVFLNDLARTFRFKLIALWQPNLFLEKKLIGDENDLGKLDPHVKDVKVAELHRRVSALLPSDPSRNFYNLSDIFNGRAHEFYIDYAHVSEEGNEVVAKKIAEIIVK
ncbi:MAG: SGNH/GDSL hydrolase family protein [Candidatus Liptonbacteria bacterium]|nr:SGNH/GDSL hydrolase family protein [Parcubacteria group bacterium]MBI4087358.1 SGNH/GDSL hydrolase family protein [Candidatus Liptonbacteria bacterium]